MDIEPSEQSSKLSDLNGLLCGLGCFRGWNTSSLLRIIITRRNI